MSSSRKLKSQSAQKFGPYRHAPQLDNTYNSKLGTRTYPANTERKPFCDKDKIPECARNRTLSKKEANEDSGTVHTAVSVDEVLNLLED